MTKICTYEVTECGCCKALYHTTKRGSKGFICSLLDKPVEHVNKIDIRCPLPDTIYIINASTL